MSQKKQGKAIKKPIVAPKRPKANPKTPKRAWAANSGLVISTVLLTVAQCSSVIGIQHAAQAAVTVFSTIEVCRGISFDFCVETSTSRESWQTKKTSKSSLMMPRTLFSLYGAYKRNLKSRRSGHLRLRRWLGISRRTNTDATCL